MGTVGEKKKVRVGCGIYIKNPARVKTPEGTAGEECYDEGPRVVPISICKTNTKRWGVKTTNTGTKRKAHVVTTTKRRQAVFSRGAYFTLSKKSHTGGRGLAIIHSSGYPQIPQNGEKKRNWESLQRGIC